MLEPILIALLCLIAASAGYAACYLTMRHANEAQSRAFDSLMNAFNARYGIREKAPLKANLAATSEVPTVVTEEKDLPKKAQLDFAPPDIKALRAGAMLNQQSDSINAKRDARMIQDSLM